jgi:hypothetical protein
MSRFRVVLTAIATVDAVEVVVRAVWYAGRGTGPTFE